MCQWSVNCRLSPSLPRGHTTLLTMMCVPGVRSLITGCHFHEILLHWHKALALFKTCNSFKMNDTLFTLLLLPSGNSHSLPKLEWSPPSELRQASLVHTHLDDSLSSQIMPNTSSKLGSLLKLHNFLSLPLTCQYCCCLALLPDASTPLPHLASTCRLWEDIYLSLPARATEP